MRRTLGLVASLVAAPFALLATAVPSFAGPSPAAVRMPAVAADAADAAANFAWINNLRVGAGLQTVQIQPWAENEAQNWSLAMASSGVLSHDMAGYMAQGRSAMSASYLGQNVGWGSTLDTTQSLLQASPGHMAILMDPRYNYVGVGAATDSQGQVWVTEDFAEIGATAPAPAPKPVAPAPAPKPAAVAKPAPAPAPKPVVVAKPALAPAAVSSPFPVPTFTPVPVVTQAPITAPRVATKLSQQGSVKLAAHKVPLDKTATLLWMALALVGSLVALGLGGQAIRFFPKR